MSNCYIPQPKPGKDWGSLEACRYNVIVKTQSFAEFFGVKVMPDIPQSVEDICAVDSKEASADDVTYNSLHLMDLAQHPMEGGSMGIDCFIAHLLQKMGFADGRRLVLMGQEWPFSMAGRNTGTFALTDVCVVDEKGLPVLLVKTDKFVPRLPHHTELEMSLVAAAVAAFGSYRHILPKFDNIIFPAITVQYGTLPAFYKIHISQQFCDYVASARIDQSPSATVYRYFPQTYPYCKSYGMMQLKARHELLRCMEAFRQLIISEEMPAGCIVRTT